MNPNHTIVVTAVRTAAVGTTIAISAAGAPAIIIGVACGAAIVLMGGGLYLYLSNRVGE